jgi:4a-hydroxytetrahydrobiopterin dehydratase
MSAKAAKTAKKAKSEKSASTPLHEAHCKPLKDAEHKLGAADVKALLKGLHGWKPIDKGEAIEKTYTFKNYYRTLAFVNALAFIAHAEDHHPDLGVHYNRCVVRYATHDVGGLSMNDFICAAKVESLPV